MFEIRKNLDLRKIFITPKIFLKSRFHCTSLLEQGRASAPPWLEEPVQKIQFKNFIATSASNGSLLECKIALFHKNTFLVD